jgi:hypothetical protein
MMMGPRRTKDYTPRCSQFDTPAVANLMHLITGHRRTLTEANVDSGLRRNDENGPPSFVDESQ